MGDGTGKLERVEVMLSEIHDFFGGALAGSEEEQGELQPCCPRRERQSESRNRCISARAMLLL